MKPMIESSLYIQATKDQGSQISARFDETSRLDRKVSEEVTLENKSKRTAE